LQWFKTLLATWAEAGINGKTQLQGSAGVTTIAIVPELLPRLERWLDDRVTAALWRKGETFAGCGSIGEGACHLVRGRGGYAR
jgi:hypothetical protein